MEYNNNPFEKKEGCSVAKVGKNKVVKKSQNQTRAAAKPAPKDKAVSEQDIQVAAYYRWLNSGASHGNEEKEDEIMNF